MEFFKKEKFNKNDNQNTVEDGSIEEKIPKTIERQEENVVNQDPDYGVLSKARAFETRKHLFELIEKAKKEKDEKNLLKIKEEINEIIGNKKDQ